MSSVVPRLDVSIRTHLWAPNVADVMATVVVWGATGHAKVVRPMIEAAGHVIGLLVDRDPHLKPLFNVSLVSPDAAWEVVQADWMYVVAIGGTSGRDRVSIAEGLERRGLSQLRLIHERAWVAESAVLGKGVQVCALAGISEETTVGDYSIINTAATVDHDCTVGAGVHVMPGATVAGAAAIEDFVTIGSNATVLPRVRVGRGSVIGAGAVVVQDVPEDAVVKGVPAR